MKAKAFKTRTLSPVIQKTGCEIIYSWLNYRAVTIIPAWIANTTILKADIRSLFKNLPCQNTINAIIWMGKYNLRKLQ